jgi:hypothetical protein
MAGADVDNTDANNTLLQLVPDYRIKAALTWRF